MTEKDEILELLADSKNDPRQNAVELIESMFEHFMECGCSEELYQAYQLKKYLQTHMMQDDNLKDTKKKGGKMSITISKTGQKIEL